MSWAKRADSQSAFEEIGDMIMRNEVALIEKPMIAEAVAMIAKDHAPADPEERCEYLLELAQLLAVMLAIVASVSTPPDWLQWLQE